MARTSRRTSSTLNKRSPLRRQSNARPKADYHRRLTLEYLELRQLLSVNPIISEILADNSTGIVDSSGAHSDWLEIHNPNSQEAVDLTGWKLQYNNSSPTIWTFPSMTLGPGESRVVFCTSGISQTDPKGELHANFNLSKSGKYLALLDNNSNVVQEFSPTFPVLGTDVSYGTGEQVTETKLIAAGATARYFAPTSNSLGSGWTVYNFRDTSWQSGPTGLGFVNLVPGLAVANYKASVGSVGSVAEAQAVIDNASNQSWVMTETASVINYLNTGGSGEFGADNPFPGMPINTDYDVFVTKVTGLVHIPSAGNWTFGVNSDDGFSCTVNGQTFAFDGLRGPSDSFGTVYFAAAGDYDLSLVSFENGGGSGLELFAASGQKTVFDSTFHLVGDTASGGLSVQSTPFTGSGNSSVFANAVKTNVQPVMLAANNTSLYTRIKFDVPNLASLQSLTLKMKYDDGYVAYLNGVEVARRNAPTTVTWNSQAVAERPSDMQSTTFEYIDVTSFLNSATPGHLTATNNVLAVQILKSSLTGGDMLYVPELVQIVATPAGDHFFAVPSPGTANTIDTWQTDVSFSVQHGFFYQSFPLAITTTTTGANIYYTLDGSTPSATHGTLYTAPIAIGTTATVRAIAVAGGGGGGVVSTETYIFPEDVVNQPSNPAGFPAMWGVETADYAMDPRITDNPLYASQMVQDLLSLPTMSIVTDQANLFDPVTGIYANALNTSDMEVPASLEYFDPATGETFQINAALRMQGGVGRYPGFEKHSFRFVFKAPYGPSKLDFPLFGDEATDSFDTVTLRSNFNDAWVWGQNQAQYIRDQFADETALAMGQPASHGNYVQLYVNGLYWGVYNPTERPDTSFAATYLGGDKDNWDAINADESINDSDMTEYYQLAYFDFENGSTAAFQKVQGNNPDGTRNPTYPVLLDMNNFVDYTLMNFYIGNVDWPNHNWYMARPEDSSPTDLDSTGFKFFPWDSEMATGLQWAYDPNVNSLGSGSWGGWVASMFNSLMNNADFRMMYADHAQKFLFNDGPLTVAAAQARYQALADEIEPGMATESARWGDVSTTLYTPADWTNSRDYVLNTWLAQRTNILIQQLRNEGLFSATNAPTFALNGAAQYGGLFNPGDVLTLTASASPIYYTLNGTDPRLPGGGLNPSALLYTGPITLTQGVAVKARIYSGGTWSALADAGFYVNLAPSIRITEMMYHPADATADEISRGYAGNDNDDFEYIEIKNIGATALPLAGLRFDKGITFTFPNIALAPNQYILVVANQAAFHVRYPSVSTLLIAGQYSGHLDSAGEQIQLDAPSGGIVQNFTYSDEWYEQTDGDGFSLTVRDPAQTASLWASAAGWRASAAPNGSPGAAETSPIPNPGSIVINEVLAHPSTSGRDMIELYNTTSQPINVGGWFLSDSSTNRTKYQIAANTTIAAGAYLVLTDERNYGVGSGDPGAQVAFALPMLGGDLYLTSNYSGLPGGYREHVGIDYAPTGVSQGLYTKSTGESDFTLLQTPTFGAAPTYVGADNILPYVAPVVIDELMYHPTHPTAAEQTAGFVNEDEFEFLELYNRSGSPQTLRDLYVTDGVGFTFGWYPDGTGSEAWTLESAASATWSTSGLQAAAYTVYAHFSLVDGNGARRTNLDSVAQYTISYAGGSATVTVDQNQTNVSGNEVWVNLGVYAFNGPATVTLTRGDADPNEWTIADTVKLTSVGHSDVVLGNPALNSFATASGLTTLAPGAYVVLVSNYAAFDLRHHIAANQIPVAGVYTGHLNNGGEMVRLDQLGDTYPGYIASYQIDHVNYGTAAPWPIEADGSGPALIRIHTADYGNDPINWEASNSGGTPGAANIPIDNSAPTIPTNLVGHVTFDPTTITLTWTASADSQSNVDHYVIYRNNVMVGTATTTSYGDTDVQAATSYTYTVSAVNSDGFESGRSTALTLAVPGIVSYNWPDNRHIEIYFNEPLNPATAGVLSHYVFGGGTFSNVALSRNNTKVTLTTGAAMTDGVGYTVTMNGLTTASGNELPASQQLSFTYVPQGTGSILREYWSNIEGNAVSDLTSNPNYPNSPSGRDLLTSFEAPANWAEAYGTRIRGYLSPPVTGNYTFWIASDDNGELWLSTDDSPANKVLIAYVTSWTGSRDWANGNNPTQQSVSIYLQAGQRYYIEALQKEGGGGDNLAVRWQLPDGSWENGDATIPIPGIRLSPYGDIDFTGPSAPATVQATFNGSNQVSLAWSPAIDVESGVDHYVIYRDGVRLGTSTTASFTDSNGVTAQVRRLYQISAVNFDGVEGVRSLTDNVITASIASVVAGNSSIVRVTFTEPVDAVSAQTIGNYQISGITVSAAYLEADNCTVTLTTSTLGNSAHTLAATNVKNRAGVTLPAQSVSFAFTGSTGTIDYDYWLNIGNGTAISDLTGNPNYPDNPDGYQTLTSFDAPYNWADNYGGRIRGYVLPPTSGYYRFWIASDGNSELWLSKNSDPAHTAKIAFVTGQTGHNVWNLYGSQASAQVYLVGGQKYYIEALQKESSGGDNLSVAWQLPGTTFDTLTGLPIAGQYLVPYSASSIPVVPFTIGVNASTTRDTTPTLSGVVSDATVIVTVRVAGTYYTATNNGDGTWTLPEGAIVAPLAVGSYDVLASAIDASGTVALDTTAGDLVIDTTSPTVSIIPVTPSLRLTPVASIAIYLSEPVAGFGLEDLQFTLGGISLPLNGATLTTSDQQNWTLGNLSATTTPVGSYVLSVVAAGSGITDAAGNALLGGATAVWQMQQPLAGDFNLDRTVDNLDLNIWKANFGMVAGATFEMGDANRDGAINGLDLDLWKATVGQTLPSGKGSPTPVAPAPLPKPPSVIPSKPVPVTPVVIASPIASPARPVSVAPASTSNLTRVTDPVSLLVMSAIYAGTNQTTNLNSQSALVAGVALPPIAYQTTSSPATSAVATLYTAGKSSVSATASLSSGPAGATAQQAAHDALFTQLEKGSGSIADGLLGSGKVDASVGLVATALLQPVKPGPTRPLR